ncbi:MAG: ATP synthase F0 subunit B [Deltaproteobacteria bacterium]|nr:ATP synthase F0 subunit B [Deltaproteobacteria bacterium]
MRREKLTTALTTAAFLLLVLGVLPVLAAEGEAAGPTWRFYWDWFWKVANFLILVVLIVKLGRQPMKEFLTGQRAKVAAEIETMEKAKKEAQAELLEIEARIANLAEELDDYGKYMSEVAQKERAGLLEDAKRETELIMDRAARQNDMALVKARQKMTAELLQLAADLAEEKLKAAIQADDQHRLVQEFTQAVDQHV